MDAENKTPTREYRAQHRTPVHRHPTQLHSSKLNPMQSHSHQLLPPRPQQDQPQPHQLGATQNQTQSRAERCSLFSPPPHPPKHFILAGDLESGVNPAQTQARVATI